MICVPWQLAQCIGMTSLRMSALRCGILPPLPLMTTRPAGSPLFYRAHSDDGRRASLVSRLSSIGAARSTLDSRLSAPPRHGTCCSQPHFTRHTQKESYARFSRIIVDDTLSTSCPTDSARRPHAGTGALGSFRVNRKVHSARSSSPVAAWATRMREAVSWTRRDRSAGASS